MRYKESVCSQDICISNLSGDMIVHHSQPVIERIEVSVMFSFIDRTLNIYCAFGSLQSPQLMPWASRISYYWQKNSQKIVKED